MGDKGSEMHGVETYIFFLSTWFGKVVLILQIIFNMTRCQVLSCYFLQVPNALFPHVLQPNFAQNKDIYHLLIQSI